jgi:hypothetical protein
MTRRRYQKSPSNPFLIWSGLAFKTTEMMMASAQVISHRTNRIAMAGPSPNERDRREFVLMGQEKIEAATESALAIAARMVYLNQQMGTLAFKQLLMGTSWMFSLAGSRTVTQFSRRQAEFFRGTVSSPAAAMSQFADSFAKVAHRGLKPIHSRATANAKRLAYRK